MDPATACFAGFLAGAPPPSYTDAEIKAMFEKDRAFRQRVVRGTAVPRALIDHLRASGVTLVPGRGDNVDKWVVESPQPPAGCTVVTDFLVFPADVEYCDMIHYIMRFNLGSVRNEPAMASMFYPYGRGEGCSRDAKTFDAVRHQLIEAFQSYSP